MSNLLLVIVFLSLAILLFKHYQIRQEQLAAKKRREEQQRRRRAAAQEYMQQYQTRLQEIEAKNRQTSGNHLNVESAYRIGKSTVDGAGKVLGSTARVVGDVAGSTAHVVGTVAGAVGGLLLLGMLQKTDKSQDTYVSSYTRKDGTKVRGHWRSK